MGSERAAAKKAITEREENDPELGQTLTTAHQLQLELAKETNRHTEAKIASELGFFGRLIGGEKTAPVVIALIVVLIGFGIGIGCLIAAGNAAAEQVALYDKYTERGFAIGTAALANLFGKGSR